MFSFEGFEGKSKSEVALKMLKAEKGRMEISKALGITYQTVHAIMKKNGIKPVIIKKAKAVKTEGTKTTKPAKTAKVKKEKKAKVADAPVIETDNTTDNA
jgi:copper homeostasis protein CutC